MCLLNGQPGEIYELQFFSCNSTSGTLDSYRLTKVSDMDSQSEKYSITKFESPLCGTEKSQLRAV
jgi:hypothetical protein